ncbi:hypothetical protein BRE01_55100 [Brevibacillus reuszeri]|uniref:Uncharacterized protein n=1 Tax=Brevibacillus reuszeri TaxID=54915 RepID=A0ABQ0TXS9_9BACL|nr:hypothetical protein BRE01_55100 [Brevibacillus reuszeri]
MEVPYLIEQPSDRFQLSPSEVAIVFPDLHVRVYNHIRELFISNGLRYPSLHNVCGDLLTQLFEVVNIIFTPSLPV